MKLPSLRTLFIPDPGNMMFDVDLDRADAQVVAWEADDDELKQMFREGIDIHTENAKVLFNTSVVTSGLRKAAKQFVHGTNYGGSAWTMARTCGIPVHDSERAQRRWFSAHPGIQDWHNRTTRSLQTDRRVWNAFGYSRLYWDRIDRLLPEALAWVPQSTVGIVINKGDDRLHELLYPSVITTIQVHDSLVGQFPISLYPGILRKMEAPLLVPVPYADPLIISVGFKVSLRSWGETLEVDTQTGRVNEEEMEKKLSALPNDTARAVLWEQINEINRYAEEQECII